ncbi:MAG: hypothetical protein RLY31_1990 [Bacteroidota bacterium]
MRGQLGPAYEAFADALSAGPVTSVRLHPEKGGRLFADAERPSWYDRGRYLPVRPVFTLDPAFHAGAYYVQEASSMFVGEALRQIRERDLGGRPLRVLDLCAAPGGKSTLLSDVLSDDLELLVANEAIQGRVAPLRHNLHKWGIGSLVLSNHDPADFRPLAGFFDVVLVDAPCSGEGLFRKQAAAMAEWSLENLARCVSRQQRIMGEAQALLRPGGYLLYSTCTYHPAENDGLIDWILSKEPGLVPVGLETGMDRGIDTTRYGYQFYPHRVRGEGFYLSVLRRDRGKDGTVRREERSGIRDARLLDRRRRELLRPWLPALERLQVWEKPDGQLFAFPADRESVLAAVAAALPRRGLGLPLGGFKGRDFVPSHALAMSGWADPASPSLELSEADALQYLRREPFPKPEQGCAGWVSVRHEGRTLGWAKVLPDRINNYLPPEWRIRMAAGSQAQEADTE